MAATRQHYPKPGTAPGTLEARQPPRVERVRIQVICYGPDHLEEKEVASAAELAPYRDAPHVTWINIEGLDPSPPRRARRDLRAPPAGPRGRAQHRPAPEDRGVPRPPLPDPALARLRRAARQRADRLLPRPRYIITVQEVPGDTFDPVRERIRHGRGRMRRMGPDYLAYALIDALIDEFFPVLEADRRADRGAGGRAARPSRRRRRCSRSTASSATCWCCAARPSRSAR